MSLQQHEEEKGWNKHLMKQRREGSEKSGEPLRRSEGVYQPWVSLSAHISSIHLWIQLFNGMSAQGQRKKPPVFSSSAKNDFVTNYEPVVHFKTNERTKKKKKKSGNSERKLWNWERVSYWKRARVHNEGIECRNKRERESKRMWTIDVTSRAIPGYSLCLECNYDALKYCLH